MEHLLLELKEETTDSSASCRAHGDSNDGLPKRSRSTFYVTFPSIDDVLQSGIPRGSSSLRVERILVVENGIAVEYSVNKPNDACYKIA